MSVIPARRVSSRFAKSLAVIAALAGIATAASTASAPRSPAAPQVSPQDAQAAGQKLQYEVSVVLKLIHVYVTDKKGKPVEDLSLDDFVVTDNDKPVKLTDFERHLLRAPADKTEAAEPAAAPAAAAPAASRLSRKFFLFFDFAFNTARGLAKARKAAQSFLAGELRPDDEVGILSYSLMKGLMVHEYLTTDHAKAREVVDKIGSKDIMGRAGEIEEQYWRDAQMAPPNGGAVNLDGAAPVAGASSQSQLISKELAASREESKRQAQIFIERMTVLAKALRNVPGQKQFILFSSGIPASLIYGGQAGNPQGGGSRLSTPSRFDPGDRVLRTLNEDMYKEFGASGCAFYTFDTRDMSKPASLFGWDDQTFQSQARDFASAGGVFSDATDIFRDEKTLGGNSLRRLSDITGGKYYGNINMYEKNLDQVQALTGSYYVLGYSIGEQADGRFHDVKVEVKRKDCEVRAQAGYFSPKPYAEFTNLEKELQLFDLALNEGSSFRMPVGFPVETLVFDAGAEKPGLEILARLPGDVTRRFTGDKVEYVALVFDEQSNVLLVRRLEAEAKPHRGQDVVFTVGWTPKPGGYTCRVVVRDMGSGMSAVSSVRTTVPRAPAVGLRVGTPLLLAPESGCAFLDADTGKTKGTPAWRGIYPYDRLSLSPAAGTVSKYAKKIAAIVPYAVPGTSEPDVTLTGHLIEAATGRRLPVALALVSRNLSQNSEALLLEFPVEGLEPGRYILYINAHDRASKTMAHSQAPLTITAD